MLLPLLLSAAAAQDLQVRAVDELLPIFPDRVPAEGATLERLDAARGTIAAVHLVVEGHHGGTPLAVTPSVEGGLVARTARLLAVPVEENTGLESRTTQWDGRPNPHVVRAAPFAVFDPVLPFEAAFVPDPDRIEAIRVEVAVPTGAAPGPRTLKVVLGQGEARAELRLPLVVHAATVPPIDRRTMCFTNWFGPAGLGGRFGIEAWSEAHWRLLEQYAELMARTRQNVFEVPLAAFLVEDGDGAYRLERARFDRYVETFTTRGVYWMEGRHVAARPGGDWGSAELELRVGPRPWPRVGSPEAESRLAAWFAPIRAVLEERGWQSRWLQHLADEPTDTNADAYRALAAGVRRELPGVRILEATMSTRLVGAVDVWCPQTRAFQQAREFFGERLAAGDEVWVYSCLAPGGPWLNRLLDQERLRAVYLGWGASRDGVTGFLHWGYNRWKADPWVQSVVDHPQAPGTRNKLPAGDTHVTYPPPDGSPGVLSSLRLEAHRLGLEDRELLVALGERDPEAAERLVARVFQGWDAYETDPARYRAARRALLEALAGPEKVVVYLLAGQSNMEGHGQVRSLPMLAEHPAHGDLLARLRAEDGSWAVRDDVFIAWQDRAPASGPLTVGWGRSPESIGPELAFGTVVGDAHEAPVLLIKTAWGGKDVYCDFRSPSAGEPTDRERAVLEHQRATGRERESGAYYRRMLAEVRDALEHLEEHVPGYAGQGYELAGLVWFQGWNDFCEWHLELDGEPAGLGLIERYPANLAALFRDLRRELGAPGLPIVVGELGVGGRGMEERARDEGDREARAMVAFRRAQRAAAEEQGLEGVTFVPTAGFWDARLDELRALSDRWWREKQERGIPDTADNQLPTPELNDEYRARGGHWYCHYNGAASTYALAGRAMAEALLAMGER